MKFFTIIFLTIISVLTIMTCMPVYAVIIDTRAQLSPNNPTVNITPEQVNEATENMPSNAPIIDPDAHQVNPPALESDNNTQAIKTIIKAEQNANNGNSLKHNAITTTQNKPNHLKALSITMSILGLICGCFAFVLKKEPQHKLTHKKTR